MTMLLVLPMFLLGIVPSGLMPPAPPLPALGPDVRYEDTGRRCHIASDGSVKEPTPALPANASVNALVRNSDNMLVGYACVGSQAPTAPAGKSQSEKRRALPIGGEGGWTTIWVLGLCGMLLFLGGLSLDLWRAFGERRNLAAAADAASLAGASGLDENRFRQDGEVRLDPSLARRLADESMANQTDTSQLESWDVEATDAGVTVIARARVSLGLVRLLMAGQPLDVRVTSTARPRGSP